MDADDASQAQNTNMKWEWLAVHANLQLDDARGDWFLFKENDDECIIGVQGLALPT